MLQMNVDMYKFTYKVQVTAERDRLGMRNFNASRPKLPAFKEQRDDMDAYLERYEQFATSLEWDEGDQAVSLSLLLQEKDYSLL